MKRTSAFFRCNKCYHTAEPMRINSKTYIEPQFCENCGADNSNMDAIMCVYLTLGPMDIDNIVLTKELASVGCKLINELVGTKVE